MDGWPDWATVARVVAWVCFVAVFVLLGLSVGVWFFGSQ